MKIEIEGKFWNLDVDKAIAAKVMTEYPKSNGKIKPGDVFAHPTQKINNLLLVAGVNQYGMNPENRYQLLGMGLSCNSNPFYNKLHSLEEIEVYLIEKEMVFVKNIDDEICALVNGTY